MLRKNIFLVIALFAMVTAILPQVQAQDMEALMRIVEHYQQLTRQATADYEAGRITFQEAIRRSEQYSLEMQAAIQQAQQASPTFTQAQLQRIEDLLEQSQVLQAQYNEGRINQTEFNRRSAPINDEYERITKPLIDTSLAAQQQIGEIGNRIKQRWPGANAGWPQADTDNGYRTATGIGPFRQASGTRASFSYSVVHGGGAFSNYTIYQTGANEQMFRDLIRQVETVTGLTMKMTDTNGYQVWVRNPQRRYLAWSVGVSLSGDTLTLYFGYYTNVGEND